LTTVFQLACSRAPSRTTSITSVDKESLGAAGRAAITLSSNRHRQDGCALRRHLDEQLQKAETTTRERMIAHPWRKDRRRCTISSEKERVPAARLT
jgi:hypothetical protein